MREGAKNYSRAQTRHCPRCGSPSRSGSQYCRQCGHNLEKPISPGKGNQVFERPEKKLPGRRQFLYALAILSGIGALLTFALAFSLEDSGSLIQVSLVFLVLFTLSIVNFAWQRATLDSLGVLGEVFTQRGLHLGWALGALALIGWVSIPLLAGSPRALGTLVPTTLALTFAALYGFLVRSQVDDPSLTTVVDDPASYQRGVTRIVFLGTAAAVLLVLGYAGGYAGSAASITLSKAYLGLGIALFFLSAVSIRFHLPFTLAQAAKLVALRSLSEERTFFLGEPLKREQMLIPSILGERAQAGRDRELGKYRGMLKGELKSALESISGIEITTAKIPIPPKMNPRYGEKEVHRFIQVSLPVHAGLLKTFISCRALGNHLALTSTLYFLGEHSPPALLQSAPRILGIFFTKRNLGILSTSPYSTRTSLAGGEAHIPPRMKAAAEMDVLRRAERDEIVDETAGIFWLGVMNGLERFRKNIEVNEKSTGSGGEE